MDIILIAFDRRLELVMRVLNFAHVHIQAVVSAPSVRAKECLKKKGMLELLVNYDLLGECIACTKFDYIVFSEIGGREVSAQLRTFRVPYAQLIDITAVISGRFSDMPLLMRWYYENAGACDVLIVGSSYTYLGIDLNCFSHTAVNFSLHSQDLHDSGEMLRLALSAPGCGATKAIIGVAPWSFEHDETLQDNGWSFALQYATLTESMHSLPIAYTVFEQLFSLEFLKLVRNQRLDLNGMRGGRQSGLFSESSLAWVKARSLSELWNHKFYPVTARKHAQELRHMIRLCRQSGVEPCLLVTPFTSIYRRYISKRLYGSFRELLTEVLQQEPARLLDFYDNPAFSDYDFFDEQHLNNEGAMKLTRLVNAALFDNCAVVYSKSLRPCWHHISQDTQTYAAFLWNEEAGAELAGRHLREFIPECWNGLPVIVYGIGECGCRAVLFLRNNGIGDVIPCDSYRAGEIWQGMMVIGKDGLAGYGDSSIIISSAKHAREIYKDLHAAGVRDKRLFYVAEDWMRA